MKCCMGKAGAAGSRAINCDLGETKIEKVDAVFNDAKAVLQAAESFRAGLEDSKATMMALSGAYTLKEGNLTDAVTLFFWGLGADMGVDKLAAMKPSIKMQEPYLEMPPLDAACSEEAKEFMEALKAYVTAVAKSADTVSEIVTKITDCSTKAAELSGTIAQDAAEAKMSAMDKVKAAKTCATNAAKIAKAGKKMTELGGVAKEAVTDMKALGEGLAGILSEAAKNVTEGTEKGAKKMTEFADKQHSKENLPEAEAAKDSSKVAYDAMKEAASKKEDTPASAAEAAPAAEEAAPASGADEVKPEDVQPEVPEVKDV